MHCVNDLFKAMPVVARIVVIVRLCLYVKHIKSGRNGSIKVEK